MFPMLEIYFETYGCTANQNSTEIMKGLISQAKLNITKNINFADIIIINSCIVKEPTQEKIQRKIKDLLKKNKKIILTGCMPKLNREKLQHQNLFLLSTNNIKKINKLIQDIKDQTYDENKYLTSTFEIKSNLPKISNGKTIGINQISEGCLGACTYCITRLAKGKLYSYPQNEILQSIKNDLNSGCKEIWITSQDNASYGNDKKKYLLPDLLKKILKNKKIFFIRLGMMNPNNILKILPKLIRIYKDKKILKFLHIPIQSGSNKILKSMNRKYTKSQFLKIIKTFRSEFSEISIASDIIVGYPGETQKDFNETCNLIQKIKPEILNVNKFWPRPGTPAEKLKQISPKIRSERAAKLLKLHFEICKQNQKKYLNTEHKVVVDKKGFENTWLAKNENYKLFAIQSNKKLLGKIINVKVKQCTPHYLICEEIVNE